MEGLDIDSLSIIAAYLDNNTLSILVSNTDLRNSIISLLDSNIFWKYRTETLVGWELHTRKIDWKKTYDLLRDAIKDPNPFTYVTTMGDVNLVEILLEAKFNPTQSNAVSLAAGEKYIEIVKLLLKDGRDDPTTGDNALISALGGKIKEISVNAHTVNRENYIDENERIPIVKLLLEDKRIDPSVANNTPIWIASTRGFSQILRLLLNNSITDPSDQNNAPIFYAAAHGHPINVEILMNDSRVDSSAQNNVAHKYAAANGYLDVIKLLQKDPRVDPAASDNVSFKIAAAYNHVEIVEFLLRDLRVNPSAQNNFAFGIAVGKNNWKVVEILLQDQRIDPLRPLPDALFAAAELGYTDTVKILLGDPRFNPSFNDYKAIYGAASGGHVNTSIVLLQDPRVNSNVREKALKYLTLRRPLLDQIEDSMSGMVATQGDEILQSDLYTGHGIYYNFLKYLVLIRDKMIDRTKTLEKYALKMQVRDVSSIVYYTTTSILQSSNIPKLPQKLTDLYFAFRGFLLLCYEPQYTLQEILQILRKS